MPALLSGPHAVKELRIIDTLIECERFGRVDWSKAADRLGMTVHDLRSRYDDTYVPVMEVAYTSPVTGEVIPGIWPIRNHPSGAYLKEGILKALHTRSASTETLALSLGKDRSSVRRRLNTMRAWMLVLHDGKTPRTWSLTDLGKLAALAIKARTGRGSLSGEGKAA